MPNISKNDLKIASLNGISQGTVYRRVKEKNWNIKDAITVPTDPKMQSVRQKSKFYGCDRGKNFITNLPLNYERINWEDKLLDAIDSSGLTAKDFIAEVLIDFLKNKNSSK